jgi:copper chaperone CopZ
VSRDPLNIALAVMAVLLLAVGGPYVVQRLGRPATIQAASILPRPQSGQKRVTLEVSGMFCANCASRVSHELETTPGVVACDVDVDAHRATVVCDRTLADTTLVRAVARAGREYVASVSGR